MVKEQKLGLMELSTKEAMKLELSQEKAISFGLMAPLLVGTLNVIISMALELMYGQMVEITKDSGLITKCMARVYSLGQMGDTMKVITLMIRNKVTGSLNGNLSALYFVGLMEEFMKESGLMEDNMEKECTLINLVNLDKGYGRTAKEFNGLKKERKKTKMIRNDSRKHLISIKT